MDDGQELFGHLRVATLGDGVMVVTAALQPVIAAPIIGDDQRSRLDRALYKATKGTGTAVCTDGQSNPSGIASVPAAVLASARLPVTNFDGGDHQRFVVGSPAFAARSPADPGLIDLDMLTALPADPILIGAHHRGAQFMEQAKGRLVPGQAKLALQLDGRYAGRLTRNQASGPEPHAERDVASFHGRADHQAGLTATRAAHQDDRPSGETKRIADDATAWARKSIRPASFFKPGRASAIIREKPLELGEGFRERQLVAVKNVHNPHPLQPLWVAPSRRKSQARATRQPLDVVGVCVKRIGRDTTFVRSNTTDGPRHHEVLIGVGTNDSGQALKVGAVISASDTPHELIEKALYELGQAAATQITTFTDGDKMLRGYLKKAGIAEDPILDWQHLSRRVQIAKTTAKGLGWLTNAERRARPLIAKTLERLHWKLWHGDIHGARQAMTRVLKLLEPFDIGRTRAQTVLAAKRLRTAMTKLRDYIEGQSAHLVNYGLRHRQGKPIGTSTTEGLANTLVNQRMNKLQQMRWSAVGAHAVVTVRAHHFNSLESAATALRAVA